MYKSSTLHHPTGFGGGHYPYKYKMHGTTTTTTAPTTTTIHFSTLSIPPPRRLIPEPSYNRPSKMSSEGTDTNAPTAAGTTAGDDANSVKVVNKRRVDRGGPPPKLRSQVANPKNLEGMVNYEESNTAEGGKA